MKDRKTSPVERYDVYTGTAPKTIHLVNRTLQQDLSRATLEVQVQQREAGPDILQAAARAL